MFKKEKNIYRRGNIQKNDNTWNIFRTKHRDEFTLDTQYQEINEDTSITYHGEMHQMKPENKAD